MRWREQTIGYAFFIIAITTCLGRLIPPEQAGADCESYRRLLIRVMVQFGATYFADNPRVNNTQLDPNRINPLSPIELFKEFYGNAATPNHFKEAILQIYYSDPGPDGPSIEDSDRIVLRNNIYTYAKANSHELAREKFGLLLYLGIGDYASHSTGWLNRRCLQGETLIANAQDVVSTELERLRNAIGEFKFSAFMDLGSGTTLAFVIDDTGSMAGEIEAAKDRANQIIDERQGSLDEPQDFVLVPFNDPTVGPLTATNNPAIFKQAIASLYAHGGGDAAELALRGILIAVENSRHGSSIFVITDIDAKDLELQDVVVAQAKQKDIKIIFLLTNRIPTTQCRLYTRTNNELENRRCLTTSFRRGYDLFEYIAQSTGGNILVVSKSDIFRATEVIDSTVKQGVVDIDYKLFAERDVSFSVQVDKSITELFVQLTGDCEDPVVTFKNTQLNITNPIIVGNLFEGKVTVDDRYGEWRVSLTAGESCQAKIQGRSTKGFIDTLGREKQTADQETLLEVFEGQPLYSDDIVIVVDSFGREDGDRVTSFEFINQDNGNTLNTISVPDSNEDVYRVPIYPNPTAPFFLKVIGVDADGFAFTRISSSPIQFVNVQINCDNIDEAVFRPGDPVNITLSLRNFGNESASFELGATDSQRYVTKGVSPSTIIIDGDSRESATFEVVPRTNAEIGTASIVTVTAKSTGLTFLLYKMCRIVVGQKLRPTVESIAVSTSISSRFAQTVMTSIVYNNLSVGREAEFQILLPSDAFITGFSMTIDNVQYNGTIEERERAERIFTAARERDLSVGHVAARDSSTTVFRTSVNLEPFKRVSFRLTYQELLKRNDGSYTYEVSVVTLQPVEQFEIDISICESEEIENVNALGFDTDQSSIPNPIAVAGISITKEKNTAQVSYRPNAEEQTQFSPLGLNGKFVVEYQLLVDDKTQGELLVSGLNFAHFASPDVDAMPKRVIFVLDVSGSMFGHKYKQLQLAMSDILDNLLPSDEFSIILFNSSVVRWNPTGSSGVLAPASVPYLEMAKIFLNSVATQGSTDILQAVQAALDLLSEAVAEEGGSAKAVGGVEESTPVADYIVLLTDGRSTEGTTDSGEIQRSIFDMNSERFGIHTIGFGTLVDSDLLSTIAAQNLGTSIQLFIDIDTHIQMVHFFNAIARPLFHDVSVEYPSDKVVETSDVDFRSYYQGNELTITGRIASLEVASQPLEWAFRGKARNRESVFPDQLNPRNIEQLCQAEAFQVADFVERLQTFIQLRNTLKQITATTNRTEKMLLRERALNQSLENGIVTPGITSLVVLKPEDRAEVEAAIEKEDASSTVGPGVVTTTRPVDASIGRGISGSVDESSSSLLLASRRPTTTSDSGSRRELAGDPHFIVDLGKQITICFDWQGKENEVYNILHDEVTGISVNAKLIQSTFVEKQNAPAFVGEIGLLFSRKNMTARIDVSRVTLTVGLSKPITMQLSAKKTIKKRAIRFKVIPISNSLSMVMVTMKKIQFKILARLHSANTDIINHLDFSVPKRKGFSNKLTGMLGQFPQDTEKSVPASISFIEDSEDALLSYRHNMVRVRNHKLFESYSRRTIDCWYVNKIGELTGDGNSKYLVADLMKN